MLPKILKDATRRKIIVLLYEQRGLSYTDLSFALKIDKGKLNYHLKLLSPILTKNGKLYTLNEQGVLSLTLLQELSYAEKKRLAILVDYGRLGCLLGLSAVFLLSYSRYLDSAWILGVSAIFSCLVILLLCSVRIQSNRILSSHNFNHTDISLHETLNSETRRSIVRLLRENGTLTYTELMKVAQVDSSGQMNYHLNTLGDLITTNSSDQYTLTDKGVFAYTLLSLENSRTPLQKPNLPQRQWVSPVAVSTVFLLGIFLLYSRGVLAFEVAILNLASVVLTAVALYYLSQTKGKLQLEKIRLNTL